MSLPQLMVAPNGARLQKADHPAVPITLDETVACAEACAKAGADGFHLHLRDEAGRHLLDIAGYDRAVAAIQARCPDLTVQITTEAADLYAPDVQRAVALGTQARHVSVSVREIMRAPQEAVPFYEACAAQGKHLQHILYDLEDAVLLKKVLTAQALRAPELQLIFVLGRYTDGQRSTPEMLDPFLDWLRAHDLTPDWAVCAFGPTETACLRYAYANGGKCRVGFENNVMMQDGSRAPDNAHRVAEVRRAMADVRSG